MKAACEGKAYCIHLKVTLKMFHIPNASQESAAGFVIQASGTVEFQDGLRTGDPISGTYLGLVIEVWSTCDFGA